jgi:hypothetical protein
LCGIEPHLEAQYRQTGRQGERSGCKEGIKERDGLVWGGGRIRNKYLPLRVRLKLITLDSHHVRMKKILRVAINTGVPRSFLKRAEVTITLSSSNVTGDDIQTKHIYIGFR